MIVDRVACCSWWCKHFYNLQLVDLAYFYSTSCQVAWARMMVAQAPEGVELPGGQKPVGVSSRCMEALVSWKALSWICGMLAPSVYHQPGWAVAERDDAHNLETAPEKHLKVLVCCRFRCFLWQ